MRGCPSGGVRLVYQNQEEEKNAIAFFDCGGRRAFGSSPDSSLKRFVAPKSVIRF
jgi:hypothetical protein